MRAAEARKSTRKPTNLSLDSALLKEAKALGINVSRSAEAGIAEAVRAHKQEKWLEENARALESSNSYVEANGLPLARYRQF
jgi:antitoxin CcdA